MTYIYHYFKRKGKNSSSVASENDLKSPEEKRAKTADRSLSYCSDSDDILNALEMAEDIQILIIHVIIVPMSLNSALHYYLK